MPQPEEKADGVNTNGISEIKSLQ